MLVTCRIQIPRIFNVYASLGMLSNWGEMLDNIFRPLFAVSCDPTRFGSSWISVSKTSHGARLKTARRVIAGRVSKEYPPARPPGG